MESEPALWPHRHIRTVQPEGSLVGREHELAILREHLAAALAGCGSLALISGEAGIGKTALAEALCREAAERGAQVLIGRCYDLSETPPFGPWREIFAGALPNEQQPFLPAAVLPSDLPGEVLGSLHATLARVLSYLAALSAKHPLVVLLDDLQWADPASLELLRVLARKVATMAVFVIVTYRPPEVRGGRLLHMLLPTLVRECDPVRLDLSPLGLAAIHALVTTRYSLPEPDAQLLTRYLAQRSDGNAFFLGELMRALHEQGGLAATAASWRAPDLRTVRVPALITQVIVNRLARFEAVEQESLAVAAVIGQEVPLGLWQSIVGMSDEDLLQLIEHAVAARVLVADDDGASVAFYHALTREVLYERMLPPQRRVLHRRIGEALTARETPPVDAIAHHFERAGDPRAAGWLVRSGEQALAAYAYLTAADRYEASMRFVEVSEATRLARGRLLLRLAWLRFYQDPRQSVERADDVLRLANDAGDAGLAAAATFSRGHFRVTAADFRGGLADIRAGVAALEGSRQGVEIWSTLLETLDAAPLEPFRPHGVLTATLAYCGLLAEARDVGERNLPSSWSSAAADMEFQPGDMQTCLGLGIAYAGLGDSDRSRLAFSAAREAIGGTMQDLLASVIDLYEYTFRVVVFQTDDLSMRRQLIDTVREAWANVSGAYAADEITEFADTVPHFLEGRWDALRKLASYGSTPPPVRFFQYAVFGDLAYASGDTQSVQQLIREVLPLGPATEPESGPLVTMLAYQRLAANVALDEHDPATARAWLEAHDRFLKWSGIVAGRAEGASGWARYCRFTGDLPRALQHADRACRLAAQPRQPLALLAAQRTFGGLLTEDGQFDRAEAQLNSAISLADACATPYERALTFVEWVALWHARGQPPAHARQARAALDDARDIFTALGAVPALERVETLVGLVDTDAKGRDRTPAGLTSRELEVLRLIAGGRSNREIATELNVSVHTVHSHVSHIFDKIGCENRAAATAFAIRHRLAS